MRWGRIRAMADRRAPAVDVAAMLDVIVASPGGMSLRAVSRATHLSPGYLSDLRSGQRGKRPSFETVQAISALFAKANTAR